METQARPYLTPEEYLAIERAAEYKSEYYAGEMFALAGASRRHNRIIVKLIIGLGNRLGASGCELFTSDMRVKVDPLGKYTYPDVVVVCGESRFEDSDQDTLLNPTIIVEVLSESTEGYDRGRKFEHYRRIESLREYLLVAQDSPRIEQYIRQEDGLWLFRETSGLEESLVLPSIGCTTPLAEIYDKVGLPDDAPDGGEPGPGEELPSE
jgi:Uma2 family endonuclease